MKRIIKKIPIYIGVFLISLAVMLGFLVLSAKVTKERVQENFEESAELVCENDVFFYVEEDVNPSCIDRYADSILLNIAYNFEPDNALESVMWSSFYSDPKKDENAKLIPEVDGKMLDKLDSELTVADVTGGIRGKVEEMLKICGDSGECVLVNGTVPGRLLSLLKGEEVPCTIVRP